MTANRKLGLMILVLMMVTLAMSSAVDAKGGGSVMLKRDAQESKARPGRTAFGNGGGTALAESCSGWCSCSLCGCNGSESCCSGGCDACWEFRDNQGLCNAS